MQGLKRQDVACNLCGENDAKHLFTVRSFNVVKRLICGLVYLNPMPRPKDITRTYDRRECYCNKETQEG